MLTKLTEWESGLSVYVDVQQIRSMRRLSASVYEPLGDDSHATELGERTRIDIGHDVILVRETPEEVLGVVVEAGELRN